MMWRGCLLVVLLAQCAWGLCPDTATQTAERLANAVTLKFYRAQVGSWADDGNSANVAVQVSDKAQTYCAASASACGLETCCSSAFKETDVGTETGYPQNKLKDMELRIYLDLPTSINATAAPFCVLSKAVLTEIVTQARDSIKDETGHWITYIDDEFFGIPPAAELNKIIIPIAFVIVILIGALVLGLNLWKKKKDSDARRMKIIEDRKKHSKSKVQPTYHIEKDPTKLPPGVDEKNKDQLYKDNLRQRRKESGGVDASQGATGHGRGNDTGYDGAQGNSYPMHTYQKHRDATESGSAPPSHLAPITDSNPDTNASPEKKKKKKKKRSKSKENVDNRDSTYESDYNRP